MIKNNILIVEFDGFVMSDDLSYVCGYDGYEKFPLCDLEYHNNWSKLMPIVEKIEKIIWDEIDITEEVIINGLSCRIPTKDNAFISIKNTKIEATYDCVVEFIKWYNEQSK